MIYLYDYASPLGTISLASDGDALCGLWFEGQKYFQAKLVERVRGTGASEDDPEAQVVEVRDASEIDGLAAAVRWLDAYFAGEDPGETCALAMHGTPFQEMVWEELAQIPYGKTTTYGAIAKALERKSGHRMSARAVGTAVGKNPVSVIVPCHRVMGANGSLTGYAGGLDRKRALLELEGVL